jgi:hypothetical protein
MRPPWVVLKQRFLSGNPLLFLPTLWRQPLLSPMAEDKHLKSCMCRGLISAELLLRMLDYYPLLAEVSGCQEVIPVLVLHSSNAN